MNPGDDVTTHTYTFHAVGMPMPPKRSKLQRLIRWLLRRVDPPPVQPPGTFPMTLDMKDGDKRIQIWIPAAKLLEDES